MLPSPNELAYLGMSSIRFSTFPRTEPPQLFVGKIVEVFERHEQQLGTLLRTVHLKSDEALAVITADLMNLGFDVETGKKSAEKIKRPVFFGENGQPGLQYEIDAFHPDWSCGLEVEAGRAWMGNAIYRDLIQALVMVNLDHLILAVSNAYHYKSGGKEMTSRDYDHVIPVADALYGHSRIRMPFSLTVIGY